MVSIEKNKRNVSGFKTEEHQKNCEKVSGYTFLTLSSLVAALSSANNFCKQLGSRS